MVGTPILIQRFSNGLQNVPGIKKARKRGAKHFTSPSSWWHYHRLRWLLVSSYCWQCVHCEREQQLTVLIGYPQKWKRNWSKVGSIHVRGNISKESEKSLNNLLSLRSQRFCHIQCKFCMRNLGRRYLSCDLSSSQVPQITGQNVW